MELTLLAVHIAYIPAMRNYPNSGSMWTLEHRSHKLNRKVQGSAEWEEGSEHPRDTYAIYGISASIGENGISSD